MFVILSCFKESAPIAMRDMPPDHRYAEIPDAKGLFVCRDETVPEGFAILDHLPDGELIGTLCQKK